MSKQSNIHSSEGKVKCSGCGNYHWQWWMISHKKRTAEKIGCASYMEYHHDKNRYQIHSSYGSGYDMMIFDVMAMPKVSGKHLNTLERLTRLSQSSVEHVICDKCIERLIRKKQIKPIDD